tara:strand:- start:198 stop:467 length:270 start_codon:yes stop_codon:yes gene_type:complete
MAYKLKCTYNMSSSPNYKTIFQWEDYAIEIDYNYDSDSDTIKVNGESWDQGANETLDNIIEGLAVAMTGLEWEDLVVGEELDFDPDNYL